MGQLSYLPFDPDESRAVMWGPQRLEYLLGDSIDIVMRTSGECAATAVWIVDVLGLAWLARGSRGEAADTNLDAKPKPKHERLLERD